MAGRFQTFGNELYTGARSIQFVNKRKIWLSISLVLMIICILIPVVRGFNWSVDFRGGSQFTIPGVGNNQTIATKAVQSVLPNQAPQITVVNKTGIQVTTDQLTSTQNTEIVAALASGYKVKQSEITSNFVGPSWGADVSDQAIRGLVIFLILAFIGMALYFRTWKMSLAAIITLFHDLIFTAGVYALTGFSVSPATVIGFLTILAYSLYDTVVVFDKIRENTRVDDTQFRRSFSDSVNLAVNQTLVRSINTAVVAALPVAGILFIGSFVLGAATLEDISLSLFIGILIGTYSTIFVAAPLYAWMRQGEQRIKVHDRKAAATIAAGKTSVVDGNSEKAAVAG